MSFLKALPETLRTLRQRAGMSQREVAERSRASGTGLTQAMVSQWERGAQQPSLESLDALLDALGVTLATFCGVVWSVGGEEADVGEEDPDLLEALLGRRSEKAPLERELEELDGVYTRLEGGDGVKTRAIRSARRTCLLHRAVVAEQDLLSELLAAAFGEGEVLDVSELVRRGARLEEGGDG